MTDPNPRRDGRGPRRRRRARRFAVTLVVLLVLLGGLLFVADRMGKSYAERRVADQFTTEIAEQGVQSQRPEVTVHGVPFLTQVLDGNYDRITVLLRDVSSTNGETLPQDVTVQRLDVEARDVSAPVDTLRSGQGDIVARTVEGTALIDYASVSRLVGQPGVELTERDGELAVTAPLQVLGLRLVVNGTAQLTIAEGALQVRFRDLTAQNLPQVPGAQAVVSGFARQLAFDLSLGDLPFGLAIQEVRPLPEGLRLTATAANVPLNQAAG